MVVSVYLKILDLWCQWNQLQRLLRLSMELLSQEQLFYITSVHLFRIPVILAVYWFEKFVDWNFTIDQIST